MLKGSKLQTNSILPSVKTYGYFNGSNSAAQSALNLQSHENNQQNELNNKHGGGSGNMRVIVPQASTHGMTMTTPNNANSNSVKGAITILQSNANAEFDNQVGKDPSQTGGRKTRYLKRKKREKKSKKSRRSSKKSAKRKTNKKRKYRRNKRKTNKKRK